MFLDLKTTRAAAMRRSRVTTCQSPYLDVHGEEDYQLRRGRPLRLSDSVYGALSHLWAAAGLDFDSYTLHHARWGEQ